MLDNKYEMPSQEIQIPQRRQSITSKLVTEDWYTKLLVECKARAAKQVSSFSFVCRIYTLALVLILLKMLYAMCLHKCKGEAEEEIVLLFCSVESLTACHTSAIFKKSLRFLDQNSRTG